MSDPEYKRKTWNTLEGVFWILLLVSPLLFAGFIALDYLLWFRNQGDR